MISDLPVSIAGVDGCKGGWIVVRADPGQTPAVRIYTAFAALVADLPSDAIVAVDMPIGLPDVTHRGARGPEGMARPLLKQRQSSVFSIPSRSAVHAETAPFTTLDEWYAAHRRASEVARRTSNPPRGISIQAFGIFPKIREIDALLIAQPQLRSRICESHPEVAFCRLNDGEPMSLPKKIKGMVNPAGMAERKALLCRCGYEADFLDQRPPRGAAADDFLDAAVMMLVAARIVRGEARPLPDPPLLDRHGIPITIWS